MLLTAIEIRNMVYRFCFVRPVGIAPIHLSKRDDLSKFMISQYKYAWDGYRQIFPAPEYLHETLFPTTDGSSVDTRVTWVTQPTPKQLAMISDDKCQLPDTPAASETVAPIEHFIKRLGNGSVEIHNSQIQRVAGFFGVCLTATSKQVSLEAREILYKENTFVFNFSGVHRGGALEANRDFLLGRCDNKGTTHSQISNAMNKLFDRDWRFSEKDEFTSKDPFIYFLGFIGSENTSLLRSLKFAGVDRSRILHTLASPENQLGMKALLPIYTHVLGSVCRSVTALTISHSWGTQNERPPLRNMQELCISTATELSSLLHDIVDALPALRVLRLEWAHIPTSKVPCNLKVYSNHDRWVEFQSLVKIVEGRERDRRRRLRRLGVLEELPSA